jgi:hypothetical protein
MCAMTQGGSVVRRHRRAPLVTTLAATLVLAACGGGDEEADANDDGTPDAEQSRNAGSLVEVSPLTGEQIGDDAPAHPVVVVKIDNTAASAPQVGLGDADLVVEELVEGGATRLAAFYWDTTPTVVGPVRSMRATDIGIVKPAQAVLVASGGAPKTIRRLTSADIPVLGEGDAGFSRDDSREPPYNLMMNLDELVGTLTEEPPPGPYLPFGPEDSWPGGEEAATIQAVFSAGHTTSWRFEDGTGWVRPGSFADQGDDFVPDNVLVLRAQVGDAGYLDPAGNPVPETKLAGSGAAMLFHDGEAIEARWSKDGNAGSLRLTTREGEPLQVPVGTTWIELVPTGSGSLTYGK